MNCSTREISASPTKCVFDEHRTLADAIDHIMVVAWRTHRQR